MNTQITKAKSLDVKNLIFSDHVDGSITDSKPKIEYKRINISIRNEDGTIGELILPTTRLFSHGVSAAINPDTGAVNGYSMPFCLWNQDRNSLATQEELDFTNAIQHIVDASITHVLENKDELEQYDLTQGDLTKSKGGIDPYYWRREKVINSLGKTELKIVQDTGPTLYAKLLYSKKSCKFITQFYDLEGKILTSDEVLDTKCYAKGAIKIESIFIGAKVSLQIKLYEAVIEPIQNRQKRLLS
jgi:hypothetical protein